MTPCFLLEALMQYPGRVVKVGEKDVDLVDHIVAGLTKHGYVSGSAAGSFNAELASLIRMFQAQHVDAVGNPLKVDGEVGSLTWGALFGAEPVVASLTGIASVALSKATSQIGVMEVPPGSNAGKDVEEYLGSVGLGGGYFWCMAFVHWCFLEASEDMGVENPFPKTAGCLDAWNKVKKASRVTRSQAIADPSLVSSGSVFILDYGKGLGHTGFVKNSVGGAMRTIEGNSNNDGSRNGVGVFELRRRNIMDKNLKGFINIA
jgi:hypothetical protein